MIVCVPAVNKYEENINERNSPIKFPQQLHCRVRAPLQPHYAGVEMAEHTVYHRGNKDCGAEPSPNKCNKDLK